jgi:opacity protein-like surface antigen
MKHLVWLLIVLTAIASPSLAEENPGADAVEAAVDAEASSPEEIQAAEETPADPPAAPAKKPRKAKSKPAKKPAPVVEDEAAQPVLLGEPKAREIPPPAAPAPSAEKPPLSPFRLGTHIAYWNAKDMEDFDYGGFMGGGIVGQYQLNPRLALEGRMSAFASGVSEDTFVESAGWYENTLTLVALPIEAGVVGFLPLSDQFTAYAGGGVGFYLFDGEFTSEQGRWKQTYDMSIDPEVGFYGVLGLRWQLARNVALYAEAKYTVVEASLEDELAALVAAERTGALPFEQDVDLSGIGIQAGAIFTF